MNKSNVINFSKVYSFTNENLSSYSSLYDFKGKNVLSVLGSGDQYFSSILYGAKDVLLFDNNATTLYYFYLKYYSIKVLSYQEFIDFFVNYNLDFKDGYNKVKKMLPNEVRMFFDKVISNKGLSSLILPKIIINKKEDYLCGRVIPYLDKVNYYKLQDLLNNRNFPKVLVASLENLYENLDLEYDLMLFSNIYMYLSMGIKEYKNFLENYKYYLSNGGKIQAQYSWNNICDEFLDNGFRCDLVDAANYELYLRNEKDAVLTLD